MPDPDTFLPPTLLKALCRALSIRLITVKMPEGFKNEAGGA